MESLSSSPIQEAVLDLVIIEENLGTITSNAKELLESIKAKCATYKAENYNADNIAEAKRDRANLNTLADKVNTERLSRERKFMEPFMPFKDYCDQIKAEVKRASGLIDGVVKEEEAKEKAEKRAELETYFAELKTSLCTFEKIFDPAWLNKGTKTKDARTEIFNKVERISTELALLDRIPAEDKEAVKAFYLDTLSIEQAFSQADQLQANRDRLARIEAEKAKPAEVIVEPAVEPVADDAPPDSVYEGEAVDEERSEPIFENVQSEILERTFVVRCTKEKLVALSTYLNENGIEFEKL
jgi:hypothetical protein